MAGAKTAILSILCTCTMVSMTSCINPGKSEPVPSDKSIHENMIKVNISVGDKLFKAEFHDNPTSQSLLGQMPFAVDLEDYAGVEKIFYPEKALSKKDAPEGAQAKAGDIMFYAPWGDVAIFYQDFRYAPSLIPMGRITDISGFLNALGAAGEVTFEIDSTN